MQCLPTSRWPRQSQVECVVFSKRTSQQYRNFSAQTSDNLTHDRVLTRHAPAAQPASVHPKRSKYLVAHASSSPSASVSPGTVAGAVDDFKADKRPVILYDGVCNLCNGAVNFMLDYDTQANFRLAALQSTAGRRLLQRSGRRPDDISSIVLIEERGHYIRSEAVLRIAQRISNPFPFLAWFGLPVPLFFRDWVYDQVADNRYNILGRREVCRLSDAGFEDRFIVE